MLAFKVLLASVFLNALTAITASDIIPQSPSKSKSKSRDIQYVKAADDVRSDIIKRIKTASNPKKKSRGILSHAYYIDTPLLNSDCKDTNSKTPDTCYYDPNSAGDKLNKLLLNTYREEGPTNGTGIDWNRPDGAYFGTVTDSTAQGDGMNINPDRNNCRPYGFINGTVTVDNVESLERILVPDNVQCEYRQDDYHKGACLYRPYSGSYSNLRDDLLPIPFSDYGYNIIPTGFFVAFDEGGSTDKANPYLTVVDGNSNQRHNNFIANQDPFLCTLQDQDKKASPHFSKTSGTALAAAGDPRFPHYCEIDCGNGGCGGPVDDPSLRYDYQAGHDVLAKNKDEGPIVEKNGQPISYVGDNGKGWFNMFINKPCLDAGATASSCKFLDFRQCAWVRDSDSKLTGDKNKVYNAWLEAKKTFERKFKKFGIKYDKNKENKDVLEKIMKFMPHALFDEITGDYSTSPYLPLTTKYEKNLGKKPEFYFEPGSGTGNGEGLFTESEVPIYMDRLKDAKRLDAPYQRYDRGPSVFGDDFLAVYAWHGNCTEQFGEDAPQYCDEGDFGYSSPTNGSINDVLQNTDFYRLTESTACWTADQISKELGRFVPVMRFTPLAGQITPGAVYQWNDKKLTRPEHYIPDFVNCCNVFTRTKNDQDTTTTFADIINDNKNKYYKKGKHRVICP